MMAFNLVVAFVNALLLLRGARAMPWIEPGPTPAGLMQMEGMSPRPTKAPGSNDIPHELLKRAGSIIFPPPNNWCGFVNGDYNNQLSCTNTALTCVLSGVAAGCCSNLKDPCSNLFTTCLDFTESCGKSCQSDSQVLYCARASLPYCGTFAFPSKYQNLYCNTESGVVSNVAFLNDVYETLIGSTIAAQTSKDDFSISPTASASASASASVSVHSLASSASAQNIPSSTTKSPAAETTTPAAHHGIAVAAIAGIVVGVCGSLALIAGIFIFLCVQRRNRDRAAAAAATQPRPPATFDNKPPIQEPFVGQGYQESQSLPSNPAFGQAPQSPSPPYSSIHTSTFGGQPPAFHSPLLPNDPNRMSNISPPPLMQSPNGPDKAPFSPHSAVSEIDIQRINTPDYYKQPVSPTITEVNGISANAGAPTNRPVGNNQNLAHEVSGEPLYSSAGQSHRHTTHNLIHEVSASQMYTTHSQGHTNAHEVSADPEQRYQAYSPDSGPVSTDYSDVAGSHPQGFNAPNGQQSHVGPWELSQQEK